MSPNVPKKCDIMLSCTKWVKRSNEENTNNLLNIRRLPRFCIESGQSFRLVVFADRVQSGNPGAPVKS